MLGLPSGPAHAQIAELPRPPRADTTTFGVSVAVDDSLAVVGASGEQSCGVNAGAVYVYRRTGPGVEDWRPSARLVPRDCKANMFFGETVALSGSRLLVGASSEFFADEQSNAAYVFERGTDGWTQTARLTADPGRREGLFAAGLDLDGDRAVVTTTGSAEGRYGGAAYVFDYRAATGQWRRTARLTSGRGVRDGVLGHDVALDGDRLAVAASTFLRREPGSVYLFQKREDRRQWRATDRLADIESFFIDLALDGETLVIGEDRAGRDASGAVTVYRSRPDGTWRQEATLRPSIPYESGGFGGAVSVREGRVLATGYDEQLGKDFNIDRVVYVFRRRDGRWRERPIIDIGAIAFGAALAQDDRVALISSVPEDRAGTVYVVQLP